MIHVRSHAVHASARVYRAVVSLLLAAVLSAVLAGALFPASTAAAASSSATAAAAPTAPEPVTLQLSTFGSKDEDYVRTQGYYELESGDWTGLYVRPGIKARFKITLATSDPAYQVEWAYRLIGRVDANQAVLVRARYGGSLHPGENVIEMNTTGRKVGQALLVRNDRRTTASVTIESLNADNGQPSLGAYPLYVHDPARPEKFWDYLQQLRAYVAAGVDNAVGQLVQNPALNMDATSILLGRMAFDLRAAKALQSLAGVTTKEQAIAWVTNAYAVSQGRLDDFDHLMGYSANDPEPVQQTSRMKVVLELTQNLRNPSTMFAWLFHYHLPETSWPGVATSVAAAHGWGNDHEYGHMVDLKPLAIAEETNNQISMWGRRIASIDALRSTGAAFATTTYHTAVQNAQRTLHGYLNARLAGENPTSPWGGIWYDVLVRFNVLHWFDGYDYAGYDFAGVSAYSAALAEQVKEYGGLGAVYRQVRRSPKLYQGLGKFDAAARAYSDALGFDMSEVMGRFGMSVGEATATYTARYPKLAAKVQYFSIDADANAINGGESFSDAAAAPTVTVAESGGGAAGGSAKAGDGSASGAITIRASYPAGSAEAKSASGYELRQDGKAIRWSLDGAFTVEPVAGARYAVAAYDVRANPSPEAVVPGYGAVFDVSFDAAGGSVVEGQQVMEGERVAEPTAPVRAGFTFGGWFADKELTRVFDFNAPLTGGVVLYAKWVAVDAGGGDAGGEDSGGGAGDGDTDGGSGNEGQQPGGGGTGGEGSEGSEGGNTGNGSEDSGSSGDGTQQPGNGSAVTGQGATTASATAGAARQTASAVRGTLPASGDPASTSALLVLALAGAVATALGVCRLGTCHLGTGSK